MTARRIIEALPTRPAQTGGKGFDSTLSQQGWERVSTGGGCEAFSKTVGEVMFSITDDGACPTSGSQPCVLSLLEPAGEQIGAFDMPSVAEAVQLVSRFLA